MAKDFSRIRKIPGVSQDLVQLQANIDTLINEVQQEPPLRGVLLKDVSIATTDTFINHGLGRAYQGFMVARLRNDARIWEPSTDNNQPTTQIILIASAACTASIWVY